jgi:Zn-dependent protease with chaperone function
MTKLVFSSIITLGSLFIMVGLIIFLAMGYADAYDTQVLIFAVIFLNLVSWLLSPMLMDIINYYLFKQYPVDSKELKEKYPHVYEIIDSVSKEYNFKFPKFFIVEDNNPTAFTYGSGRFNARIVVSQGIFKYLNEKETKAVIAHELGHIVNRDFIVMMIAATLLEILYIIYDVFARSNKSSNSSSNSKNEGSLAAIGLLSYVFYFIGSYLILYLSRTREYLADNFSATKTNAEDLANALIKLAYGIIAEEDSDTSHRLLGATRALGVIDVENSKQVGATSYITNNNKDAVSEVMVFDYVSPWAFILELSSTHPLTGKRILALSEFSKSTSKSFSYDIEGTAKKMNIDYNRIYNSFSLELFILSLPFIGFILGIVTSLIYGGEPFGVIFTFTGLGLIIRTMYTYSDKNFQATTILNCMRNVYATPFKGTPVQLEGKVIGRGVPGYVFGEDMMYQDKTGIIFMDHIAGIPFLGNLLFAISKLKKLLDKNSTVNGWFFRGNFAHLSLSNYTSKETNDSFSSYPVFYSYLGGIIFLVTGIAILLGTA